MKVNRRFRDVTRHGDGRRCTWQGINRAHRVLPRPPHAAEISKVSEPLPVAIRPAAAFRRPATRDGPHPRGIPPGGSVHPATGGYVIEDR